MHKLRCAVTKAPVAIYYRFNDMNVEINVIKNLFPHNKCV